MFFEPIILMGGIVFYILLAIFAVLMLATVEYDKGWASVWTVGIFVLLLSQLTDVAIFGYILANPFGAVW